MTYSNVKNGIKEYANTNVTGTETMINLLIKNGTSDKVRTITLPEINKALGRIDIDSLEHIKESEDSYGIFKLLSDSNRMPGNNSAPTTRGDYWIASPGQYGVIKVKDEGEISSHGSMEQGIRPVVHLIGEKMQLIDVGNGTYKFTQVD